MPNITFERIPSAELLPLPRVKPVTQAWRYEGRPCPYIVVPLESLTEGVRIPVSRIFTQAKTQEKQ